MTSPSSPNAQTGEVLQVLSAAGLLLFISGKMFEMLVDVAVETACSNERFLNSIQLNEVRNSSGVCLVFDLNILLKD